MFFGSFNLPIIYATNPGNEKNIYLNLINSESCFMKIAILAVFSTFFLVLNQLSAQSEITIYDGTSGIQGTRMQNDTAEILSIIPKSPASKAGLRYHDQILRINGHPVSGNGTGIIQLKALLTGSANDSLSLLVKKNATDSLISLSLYNDLHLHELIYDTFEYLVDSLEKWTIRDISADSMQLLFSDPSTSRCLVHSVEPGSKAAQKGLLPGDLIISLRPEMKRGDYEIGMDNLDLVTVDSSIVVKRDSQVIHLDLNPSIRGSMEGVLSQYKYDFKQSCIWLKINTANKIINSRPYLFSFPEMAGNGIVDFYEISSDGGITDKRAGISLPVESRDFNYKDWCAVQVHLVKGAKQTFYARLSSENDIESPYTIVIAQETILSHDRIERMILSGFYGMMLIISLYYLVLFFTGRQPRFIFFSLYILSFGVLLFTLEGFPAEYAWKHTQLFNTYTSSYDFVLFSMVSVFFLLFGRAYLDLKRSLKGWNISVLVLIGLIILSITLFGILNHLKNPDLEGFRFVVLWAYLLTALLFPMFILIIPAIMRIREGSGPAWFFLISNIFLAISIFLSYNTTSIRFSAYTLYRPEFATMMLIIAVYLAAVIQFLLFSVGLAQKMKIDEKEKKLAQERVIEQLKENEKLKDKVTRELEQKVQERTREIREQKEEIEAQRDEIETQRDHLTDSINYAERIQAAVMPHQEYVNAVLPEYFILFKPRDIVSGDFYWIREIKDHLVVAAADCTGHGVPGAFMSMLGIAFLNEQIGESQIESPGNILNNLRKKMKETLAQEGRQYEQQDGMDIALAIIDRQGKELQFAGAYNPLYIIRKQQKAVDKLLEAHLSLSGDDYQLFELKGDRQPIAIHSVEADFESMRISLQKGDSIYLFSDGFVDQKGGPGSRKFLSKNFKKLLLEIQHLSMDQQKSHLEERFESWRNGFEQMDDVLVMGIRI